MNLRSRPVRTIRPISARGGVKCVAPLPCTGPERFVSLGSLLVGSYYKCQVYLIMCCFMFNLTCLYELLYLTSVLFCSGKGSPGLQPLPFVL